MIVRRRGRANLIKVGSLTVLGLLCYWHWGSRSTTLIPDKILKMRLERFTKYQESEAGRTGPGEHGAPVVLTGEDKYRARNVTRTEGFNRIASDKVCLERSLSDVRKPGCQKIVYPKELPTASVVIIFHNEAWSPLLRTAHSVVNRSPPQHLHEVILVDDFSNKPFLGEELKNYVESTWPDGVVKLVRLSEWSGLIRARLAGARAATGDVLVFLDSHCEAGPGWLEPLLARIKEKRNAVVCPEVDDVNKDTMQYKLSVNEFLVGGFMWTLYFSWHPESESERKRRQALPNGLLSPRRSPTMIGGLFAVDRKYFHDIGSYDSAMNVWGGENVEISFRIWMCGGSLEIIPCSHVGHMYRTDHPFLLADHDSPGINTRRVAEVWLDEYKRLFYLHRQDLVGKDYGDISERLELRKRLKCASFSWYMKNIYPEKFIPDTNVQAYGTVRHLASNQCLDTLQSIAYEFDIGVFGCSNTSGFQLFSLTFDNRVRKEKVCMDSRGHAGSTVHFRLCVLKYSTMKWKHDKIKRKIMHEQSGLCLDMSGEGKNSHPVLNTCKDVNSQIWSFSHYLV